MLLRCLAPIITYLRLRQCYLKLCAWCFYCFIEDLSARLILVVLHELISDTIGTKLFKDFKRSKNDDRPKTTFQTSARCNGY